MPISCNEIWEQLVKMRCKILISIFFTSSIFLLLLAVGVTSSHFSGAGQTQELKGNQTLEHGLEELKESIKSLQKKLDLAEEQIQELRSDLKLSNHHLPTTEHLKIQISIQNWESVSKTSLSSFSTTFDSGKSLGSYFHSTWTFYLSLSSETFKNPERFLNVHLALDKYSHKIKQEGGALYAGFNVKILGEDGQVWTGKHEISNLLDTLEETETEEWHELKISRFVALDELLKLLVNGTLTLEVHFQLVGKGHRIYHTTLGPHPLVSDNQSVQFSIPWSNKQLYSSKNDSYVLAFSRFQLLHPFQSLITSKWNAEVLCKSCDSSPSVSLVLTLVSVEVEGGVEWGQFFASLKLDVQSSKNDTKGKIWRKSAQDFVKYPQVEIGDLVKIDKTKDSSLIDFKISLTAYNRNAMFYFNL